jgi:hypothetical protein
VRFRSRRRRDQHENGGPVRWSDSNPTISGLRAEVECHVEPKLIDIEP